MKIWNLTAKTDEGGAKCLDVQIHGVIDGGWFDDESVSTAEIAAALADHQDAKAINVHINSIGGSLFGGVALYNVLNAHPAEVTCYVDGLAASAASLIAMAGKTVMGRGSMLMIHNPMAMAMGDAKELRRQAADLDKAQASLVAIYKAKTGKDVTAIKAMLDAETFMTAEQAVRNGFADELAADAADGDGNDNEPDGDEGPTAKGESVIWNGVEFPRTSIAPQLLAMAKAPAPPAPPAPVLALVLQPEPQPPITRAELQARAPELLAALLEEGRAAGAAAERARLQAIDELPVMGCAELVIAAKYGEKPIDAPTLAVAIVKAQKGAGAELLAQRRIESAPIVAVAPSAPDQTARAEEARIIQAITDGGNARRGGKIR
jgi:ATP-dependent Clp protease protease subunit